MPILPTLQCVVEGGITNNLTFVITQSLILQGRLSREEVGERFICICVDGAFFFWDATLE